MLSQQHLQDQQGLKPLDLRPLGNVIKFVVNIWASFCYAFVRHSFGNKYYSGRAFMGVLLLGAWETAMIPYADPGLYMFVGCLFFVIAIIHQIAANRSDHGRLCHSHFNGVSRFTGKLGLTNQVAKSLIEPVLIAFAGALFMYIDKGLGMFVAIGGACCMFDQEAIRDRYREKARRVRDAELEQMEVWDTYDQHYGQ